MSTKTKSKLFKQRKDDMNISFEKYKIQVPQKQTQEMPNHSANYTEQMLDVSPYSELELSPMDLGDDHTKI
jgi:hypothetical protein